MKRLPTTKTIRFDEEELEKLEAHVESVGCESFEDYVRELIKSDMFNGDFQKRKLTRASLETVIESAKTLGIDPELAEKVILDLFNGRFNKRQQNPGGTLVPAPSGSTATDSYVRITNPTTSTEST